MDEAVIAGVLIGGVAFLFAGIAALVVVHAKCAVRAGTDDRFDPWAWELVGWVLAVSGLTTLCFFVVTPLGAMLVLFVVAAAVFRHRQAEQYALLSMLAVAAERLMPLAPGVQAFAEERGGVLGWRARRLAVLLRSGLTLPDALEQTPGLISRQDLVMIRVGQDSGALAQALGDRVQSHGLLAPLWNQILGRVLYLCVVILFALSVTTFMMIRIIPEFQKIFQEFETELPPITQTIVAASYGAGNYWFIVAVPLFLVLGVAFFGFVGQYVGGVRWDVPLTNWMTRRLDTALILDALGLAAGRGVTFVGKVATLARWYPRTSVRKRLKETLGDVDRGADWCESLAQRGLIRQAELAVLQAAQRVGNLPWALREMADSSRRRLAYRLHVLLQVLFPVTIVAFGLLVSAYVVGCLLPLISLIDALS